MKAGDYVAKTIVSKSLNDNIEHPVPLISSIPCTVRGLVHTGETHLMFGVGGSVI